MSLIKTVFFHLFALTTLVVYQTHYQNHRGFCVEFIQEGLNATVPLIELDQAVLKKLQTETFRYLASGKQCYVFESQDRSLVIKFISTKRFQPAYCQSFKKKNQIKRLKAKELESYSIAFKNLKVETKLYGIKLGPSNGLGKLTLIDPLGLTRTVLLDRADFFIQPKAICLKQALKSTSNRDALLMKTEHLLKECHNKNIKNSDPRIHRNIGVLNEQPFFLDLGAFTLLNQFSECEKNQELEKIFRYNLSHLPT